MKTPRIPPFLPASLLFLGIISMDLSICMAQSPWTQKADMAAGRGLHSSCVFNGKIYSLGGTVQANNIMTTKTVQIYDPNTDVWTVGTDMLEARASFPSCVINGKIWAFGGASELWYQSRKSVEVYDSISDTWTYLTDMPRSRQGHTASLVDGKVYIIGGGNTFREPIAEVDVYDTLTKTWTTATPMPTPRSYLASVVLNNTIYTIGGHLGLANNETALGTLQAYHPATDTWIEKEQMITPRNYFSANIIGGKIYAIGGKIGGAGVLTFATHTEMYDPTTDTWTELSKVPKEYLRIHSADTINNIIYTFGGTYNNPPVVIYPTMYAYNPQETVSIPDTAFLNALIDEGVDTNGDSLISYEEADVTSSLDVSGENDLPGTIADMTGIEAFINLDTLDCSYNSLSSLNVSNNAALIRLSCGLNQLTSLDVSNNTALLDLNCVDNQLSSLDVSNSTMLLDLWCGGNQLSTLDISCNPQVGNTKLGYDAWLDISRMPSLTEVCVWESFHPDSVGFDIEGSKNFQFNKDCGICSSSGTIEYSHSEFTIFPNPSNGMVTIETAVPDRYNIEINSFNGQLIYHAEMEGAIHQLDLSSFQKGVYLITIRSKGYVTTRKIVRL